MTFTIIDRFMYLSTFQDGIGYINTFVIILKKVQLNPDKFNTHTDYHDMVKDFLHQVLVIEMQY